MAIPLGIYEKAIPLSFTWKEKFAIAKEAGFDFIEFSIDGLKPRIDRLNDSDDYYRELYRLSLSSGMPFISLALTANRYFPLGEEKLSEEGFKIVERSIEIAHLLGIKIIQIAPYDVKVGEASTEVSISRLFDNLVKLSAIAKQKDIILAPEVLEDVPFFDSVKKASSIIKGLGIDNLKVYADCGNTASIGIDNSEDLSFDDGEIVMLHVKDALIGNCRNVEFGTGYVDFKSVFRHFKSKNYNGAYVIEVWSDEDINFISKLKEISSFVKRELESV